MGYDLLAVSNSRQGSFNNNQVWPSRLLENSFPCHNNAPAELIMLKNVRRQNALAITMSYPNPAKTWLVRECAVLPMLPPSVTMKSYAFKRNSM